MPDPTPLPSYVICTQARSGSTLLSEGLEVTNIAGRPREYFSQTYAYEYERRFTDDPNRPDYFDWARRRATSPNGVYGLKILRSDFPFLVECARAIAPKNTQPPAALLNSLLPNLRYIWLRRRDGVARAVSQNLAEQTGIWHKYKDAAKPEAKREPKFDFDRIHTLVQEDRLSDADWAVYFDENGIKPFLVIYEDFVRRYRETLREVLEFLGLPADVDIKAPRLQKQANDASEEWIARYGVIMEERHIAADDASLPPGAIAMPASEVRPGIPCPRLKRYEKRWQQPSPLVRLDGGDLLPTAISLHNAGDFKAAEALYRSILVADPNVADVLSRLGNTQLHLGRAQEALHMLSASLDINGQQVSALRDQGNAFLRLRRPVDAIGSFVKAISLAPSFAELYVGRGEALRALKRYDDAIANYDKAIELDPTVADTFFSRAVALHALSRHEDAVGAYDRYIALRPDNAIAYYNRGVALGSLKRHEDAVVSYDKAVAIEPAYSEAHKNRGDMLRLLGRYDEAIASYDKAIAIKPEMADLYFSRGYVQHAARRFADAVASYDKFIALKSDNAVAFNNRAIALQNLKRYREAIAGFEQAIAVNPKFADAYLNKGLLHLVLGEYAEGWKLREWRWKSDDSHQFGRNFSQPFWLGKEPLAGKTILLHHEFGFGDTLHFCRYAPLVEALGANVVLEVQPSLVGLMSTLKGDLKVIAAGKPLPEFDYHCALTSLPAAFQTTPGTIPASVPYLSATAKKRAAWAERLGPKTRPRVGLVWCGDSRHKNDYNRSIPLAGFLPILRHDCEFHCLQKDVPAGDQDKLAELGIAAHSTELGDFTDTAALVSEMDLVITVDTAVAHLAGALAAPVWVLIPFVPDFRWMAEGEDCVWYPTARLFRQPKFADWESVIAHVAEELAALHAGADKRPVEVASSPA